MQSFLPPKEAQGKVRQSQGRAAAKNFAFSRKLILGSIGTPLDHLSVKELVHVAKGCSLLDMLEMFILT